MARKQLTLAFDDSEDQELPCTPEFPAESVGDLPATPIGEIIGNVRRSIRRIRPPDGVTNAGHFK